MTLGVIDGVAVRHIFREQDRVFPAALASLRTEDWEAVEAARAGAGSLLRTLESAG